MGAGVIGEILKDEKAIKLPVLRQVMSREEFQASQFNCQDFDLLSNQLRQRVLSLNGIMSILQLAKKKLKEDYYLPRRGNCLPRHFHLFSFF